MNPLPRPLALAILCSATLLSSCGGGGAAFNYPQNVSISMSPSITSLAVSGTQQFTATVVNYTATPTFNVQTSVVPTGTITQTGLYTAPAAPPAINYGGSAGPQAVVTVNASVAYPSPTQFFGASATTSQTFVITAPTVTAGFITTTATVPLGGTFKFQPYAVGNVNRGYTLQVNGVNGGSMSTGTIVQDSLNAGLYTAPTAMAMTGNTVTITVISQADPTKTATATVTLQ
jgi:hypothetical protein